MVYLGIYANTSIINSNHFIIVQPKLRIVLRHQPRGNQSRVERYLNLRRLIATPCVVTISSMQSGRVGHVLLGPRVEADLPFVRTTRMRYGQCILSHKLPRVFPVLVNIPTFRRGKVSHFVTRTYGLVVAGDKTHGRPAADCQAFHHRRLRRKRPFPKRWANQIVIGLSTLAYRGRNLEFVQSETRDQRILFQRG